MVLLGQSSLLCYTSGVLDSREYGTGDDKPITVAPTDAAGRVLPPVEPHSGQRPGETMEQFFSRQRDEKLKEKEGEK